MMQEYVNSSVLVNDDLCDHVEMKREDKPICSVRGQQIDIQGTHRFAAFDINVFKVVF